MTDVIFNFEMTIFIFHFPAPPPWKDITKAGRPCCSVAFGEWFHAPQTLQKLRENLADEQRLCSEEEFICWKQVHRVWHSS